MPWRHSGRVFRDIYLYSAKGLIINIMLNTGESVHQWMNLRGISSPEVLANITGDIFAYESLHLFHHKLLHA
jgi:hypothetical protein